MKTKLNFESIINKISFNFLILGVLWYRKISVTARNVSDGDCYCFMLILLYYHHAMAKWVFAVGSV